MSKKVDVRINHTIEDIIYFAGYIDGDGCFYCGRVKQGRYGCGLQFHIKLAVDSCEKISTDWMRETFGGNIRAVQRPSKDRIYERDVFTWVATGELLDYILPKIEPYLKVKKQHCQIMIELRKTFNFTNQRLPQNIIDKRLELIDKMRFLNSKSHNRRPIKQN